MKSYEILLAEAEENNILIIEDIEFHGNLKALYVDSTIGLSKEIETQMEKKCILAEELAITIPQPVTSSIRTTHLIASRN